MESILGRDNSLHEGLEENLSKQGMESRVLLVDMEASVHWGWECDPVQ